MKRRNLLTGVGASITVPIAGCMADPSSNGANGTDDPGNSTGEPEECDIEHGRWYGEADAIETTVETKPEDRIEQQCAREAAEAAFVVLDERIDIDLESRDWISHGRSYDGEYNAIVSIEYIEHRDGSISNCPDDEFEVAEARAALPEEVTVNLDLAGENEPYECTHKIEFRTGGIVEE